MTHRDLELDRLRHWRVTAPVGRLIYDEGEPALAFYRVESGCVRLQVNGEDGRRQILAFCLPGDVFGIECDDLHATAAEAAAATELSRFPRVLLAAGKVDPICAAGLMCAVSSMVSALSTHLKGLAHSPAEDRLVWFLDWLAVRQGVSPRRGCVQLPMSRRDIADFLGLAQETLSRAFGQLELRGQIQTLSPRRIFFRPGLRCGVARENACPSSCLGLGGPPSALLNGAALERLEVARGQG